MNNGVIMNSTELTDEQWYDIASAHAPRDWSGDGYLDLIKSVGRAAIRAAHPESEPRDEQIDAAFLRVSQEMPGELSVTQLPALRLFAREVLASKGGESLGSVLPTDEQIDAVTAKIWGTPLGAMVKAHRAYARAILAEGRQKP